MQVVHPICAGIDVHKAFVTVSLRRVADNSVVSMDNREFATTTPALLELLEWLVAESCPVLLRRWRKSGHLCRPEVDQGANPKFQLGRGFTGASGNQERRERALATVRFAYAKAPRPRRTRARSVRRATTSTGGMPASSAPQVQPHSLPDSLVSRDAVAPEAGADDIP